MKLIYAFDAYCGWCYGFAPTLTELLRRHPDLDVEVVSGGLFTGLRRVPIRKFGYIQGANAKISELTGVEFGPGYAQQIADGSFVMDSEAAARGVAAFRQIAPGRIVQLADAMQQAFYQDGLSLSEVATYRTLAAAAGLDSDTVAAAFTAPDTARAAQGDFARAADLGAHSFPTLLAIDGDHSTVLAVGHADIEEIERRLDALTAAI